jgi:hypothetical protein
MNEMRKYQIHCPECKHEFVWDLGPMEWKMQRMVRRVNELNAMMADLKSYNSRTQLNKSPQYLRMKTEYNQLLKDITDLKVVKQNNAKVTGEIFNQEFRSVVRERVGEEEYSSIIDETNKRLAPTTIEKLMKEGKYL